MCGNLILDWKDFGYQLLPGVFWLSTAAKRFTQDFLAQSNAYYKLSGFCRLTGCSWAPPVWLGLGSPGGLTGLDIHDGSLPEVAGDTGPPMPASHGLGFLKCGSLLRLRGNLKSSYSLAFEVREYPFYHSLLAKSPAEIQGCGYWEVWGGGGSAEGILFGD